MGTVCGCFSGVGMNVVAPLVKDMWTVTTDDALSVGSFERIWSSASGESHPSLFTADSHISSTLTPPSPRAIALLNDF